MPNARASAVATIGETPDAAGVVKAFLHASMVPDPQTAALYIAADLAITFTGGRKYRHPRETTAFNAKRYKWVKKKMERSDVVAGEGETIVYNLGTLYGEWPDGTPFEGNRYVDRFVVRDGKIVQMDVWNDSAERLLTKAWYLQAGCVLTGEDKLLDARIKPLHPVGAGGFGAVELVGRVALGSLERGTLEALATDLTANTNRMGSVTIGMNWWPVQNIRVSIDGIRDVLPISRTIS